MTKYLIVPGLGNSDEQHWQTYFERASPSFTRIVQADWDTPNRADWVATVDDAVVSAGSTDVVLIGHSLGCATIAHWANQHQRSIRGAFLVAPSDVDTPHYASFPTTGFNPMPLQPLPFPSVVVASANDPWVTLERARLFAENWGSTFINIGNAGHINVASGHGDWPAGWELLQRYFG